MSRRNCSVYGCTNTYQNTLRQGKHIHFYKFPKYEWMKERRQQWIRFAKRNTDDRKPWSPTYCSVVCSEHFIGGVKSGDPRSPSYNPSIFNPKVATDNPRKVTNGRSRYNRYVERLSKKPKENHVDQNYSNKSVSILSSSELDTGEVAAFDIKQTTEAGTQMSPSYTWNNVQNMTTVMHKMTGPDNRTLYFGGFSTLNKNGTLRAMCGVSSNVFALLLSLFPNHTTQYHEHKLEDKLVMCLFKLKSGLSFSSIGAIFGMPYQIVIRTFKIVITHIAKVTKNGIFVPSQHAVRKTLPEAFKTEYAACRLIIDCTEMCTECPSSVEAKIHLYSNYKSGYTIQYLIGITPNGLIAFLSKGYGGRSTDSFITNDCGILVLLEEGDIVLADKGFPTVQVKEGTLLVMPPFSTRNQTQFSQEQMKKTYEIAKVRIHVERAIQRIKTFDILTQRIPIDLLPRFDDVMHVCAVIVNLSSPIIKE